MWRKKATCGFRIFHGQPHTPGRGKNPDFFVGSGEVFVFGFLFLPKHFLLMMQMVIYSYLTYMIVKIRKLHQYHQTYSFHLTCSLFH